MEYITFKPCGHAFVDDGRFTAKCPVCNSAKPERKHKYHANPIQDPEHGYFHSTGEYKRFLDLLILERCGAIKNLERQVTFELKTIRQRYIVDYTYTEVSDDGTEKKIAEDFKGHRTAEYRRKKAAFIEECTGWHFRETTSRKRKK